MKVLPIMYWTPKKHKTPSGSRFIVAAKKCSLKKLSQIVTEFLKMFYRQIENYDLKSHVTKNGHVSQFWVIKNKNPVITALKKLNSRNRALRVSTFDFSTLYTNIPHAELKNVLYELADFCFNGYKESKIVFHNNGAQWYHGSNDNLHKKQS